MKIPVSWSNLNLTGQLVFIGANRQQGNRLLNIQILDLLSGEITLTFQTTGEAWIYYMSASQVHKQIVMAYLSTSAYNYIPQQALYILPLDGSEDSQLLFTPPSAHDQYLQAEWSPNGKYIYYVHYLDRPQSSGQLFPNYEIFRVACANVGAFPSSGGGGTIGGPRTISRSA